MNRREFMMAAAAAGAGARGEEFVLHTFGDSVLDCGRYNDRGVHPGQLLVRNDDALFPEFKGRDLVTSRAARLDHRAVDGATVDGLPRQAEGLARAQRGLALLSIGGNDLLRGLAADTGPGMKEFERKLARFLKDLPVRPVLIANVYDPTFGDDSRNFTGVDPRIARANHRRVNAILHEMADSFGALIDLHAHFLKGDPSWFTHTIEPSLKGASEVRRAFLPAVLARAG
jgi:acyl-CoA thioesterase I